MYSVLPYHDGSQSPRALAVISKKLEIVGPKPERSHFILRNRVHTFGRSQGVVRILPERYDLTFNVWEGEEAGCVLVGGPSRAREFHGTH